MITFIINIILVSIYLGVALAFHYMCVRCAFKSLGTRSLQYQTMRVFAYSVPSAWNVLTPTPSWFDSLIFKFHLKGNFFWGAFCKTLLYTSTLGLSSCCLFPFLLLSVSLLICCKSLVIYYSSNMHNVLCILHKGQLYSLCLSNGWSSLHISWGNIKWMKYKSE